MNKELEQLKKEVAELKKELEKLKSERVVYVPTYPIPIYPVYTTYNPYYTCP